MINLLFLQLRMQMNVGFRRFCVDAALGIRYLQMQTKRCITISGIVRINT